MTDPSYSNLPHYTTREFTRLMMESFDEELFAKCFKNTAHDMLKDIIELAKKDNYEWNEIGIMIVLKNKGVTP